MGLMNGVRVLEIGDRGEQAGKLLSDYSPSRLDAVVGVGGEIRCDAVARAHLRLIDRDVDVIAFAGELLAVERHHRRQRRDGAGLVVGERTAELQRLALGVAGPQHRTAHRLRHDVGLAVSDVGP